MGEPGQREDEKMARALTAKRVLKARNTPGRYPDGTVPGLYLQVTAPQTRTARGAASWVLRYERAGVERMAGIGPLSVVSLAEARSRAKAMRLGLLDGVDPIEAKRMRMAAAALEAAKAVTFEQAARAHFESIQSGWRNALHAREYIRSLERHVFTTIGKVAVSAIDTGLVLRVIEPLWKRVPVTAGRVRQRIEAALNFSAVRGWRASDVPNPARWRGHLEHILPQRPTTDVKHFKALSYQQMPAFMRVLREREGVAERALELCILCVNRSNEILGARWREIDLRRAVWTVSGERMKGGREHRIPLSSQAVALLQDLPGDKNPDSFIFTRAGGRALGKDSLERALARVRDDITVHGMRSTARDWMSECARFSFEVCEATLAHVVGSKSARSYARSDLLAERAKLMSMWADFCYGPPIDAGDVVPIRRARP